MKGSKGSVCDGYISGPACSSSLFQLPRKLWQSCQFPSLFPSDSLCPAYSKLFGTKMPRWELEPEPVPCGQSGVKDFTV